MTRDRSNHFSVGWQITGDCGLSCDYCWGAQHPHRRVQRDQESIARPRIAKALGNSAKAETVTFCGGEPTVLGEKLYRYAELVKNFGMTTKLNSNGQRSFHHFIAALPVDRAFPFDAIGISLDGSTQEMQTAMRGRNASLALAVAAAEWVLRQGIPLKLATVVSQVNVEHLPVMANLIKVIGPDDWRLLEYSPRGMENTGQHRHRLTDGEFKTVAVMLAELVAPIQVSKTSNEASEGCFIISPLGNVLRPHRNTFDTLGNVLNTPIDKLW